MSNCFMRHAAAAVVCLGCAGLCGCFVSNDESADQRLPTVGEELRDLKMARDEGAMDPDEYKAAKQKVLTRLDKPKG